MLAHVIEGHWLTMGDPLRFLKANIEYALAARTSARSWPSICGSWIRRTPGSNESFSLSLAQSFTTGKTMPSIPFCSSFPLKAPSGAAMDNQPSVQSFRP